METILRHARDKETHHESKELIALLIMTRTEKTIFRHQQQGELLFRDVAMRTVNFSEHRIIAPAADLQTTKTQLKQRSLEVLATVAKQKIAALQANLTELREHRERLAFMLRILGGRRSAFERSAHSESGNTGKIKALEQLIFTVEKKIELARKELDPEDILIT